MTAPALTPAPLPKLQRLSPDDAEDATVFLRNIAEDLDSARSSVAIVERLIPAFAGSMPPLGERVATLAMEVAALVALAKSGLAPAEGGAA